MATDATEDDMLEQHTGRSVFSKAELELARREYDKMRHFTVVPASMLNQVYRIGILSKKTIDGSGSSQLHGSRKYYRDSRATTPGGALIIHRDDPDPYPGNCQALIHPPYGSDQQYRGENGHRYYPKISLSMLCLSSKNCSFCSILYQGIYLLKFLWRDKLARYKWIQSHPEFSHSEGEENGPWKLQGDGETDEENVAVGIWFPKSEETLKVYLHVQDQSSVTTSPTNQPRTNKGIRSTLEQDSSKRRLAELEFYTPAGFASQWFAFGTAPHIQPELISDGGLQRIFDWLRPCVFEHPLCEQSLWSGESGLINTLPGKLVKIQKPVDKSAPPILSLHETGDSLEPYRYVALSHVWSFTEPHRTTRDNYSDHKKQIPWGNISLLIREAIILMIYLDLKLEYI